MDSGDGVLHTVFIYKSYALPHAILRLDLAGRDLTEYLMRISSELEYSFTTTAEREIGRGAKEKICYIAFDYNTELKSTVDADKKQTFELPDGNFITVGVKRFHCVKSVLPSSFTSKEANGVYDTSFMKCDADIRRNLYVNVVLSTGTTMS